MATNEDFTIRIVATLRGGRAVERVLTPEEYFDPPDADEVLECDSTPRRLEPADYIEVDGEVEALVLTVDGRRGDRFVIEERFWGNGCSAALVQNWTNGRLTDWEHTLQLADDDTGWQHVVKLGPATADAIAGVRSHTLVRPRDGGDEWKVIL